jgi:hypothetical protein
MRALRISAVVVAGLLALPAAATAAEENTPPAPPTVTAVPRYAPEIPSEAGWTLLKIQAPLLWYVNLTVRAHGAIVLEEEPKVSHAEPKEDEPIVIPSTTEYQSLVDWSCKQPGTVYSYTVTAKWAGETLTTTGSFTGATQRQCDDALRLSLRRHHEEVRRQQAKARHQLGEELARQRRFEANCRTVGGKPVTIQTSRGPEIVCRSQTGGIVEA